MTNILALLAFLIRSTEMLQHMSKIKTQLIKSVALQILWSGKRKSEKFIFVCLVFHESGGLPQSQQGHWRLNVNQPVDKHSLLFCTHVCFQE